MALPSSGWLPLGITYGAPVVLVPLPTPYNAYYRDFGAALVTPQQTLPSLAEILGDAIILVQAGVDALGFQTLEALIQQTGAFMGALLDTFTITNNTPDIDIQDCPGPVNVQIEQCPGDMVLIDSDVC